MIVLAKRRPPLTANGHASYPKQMASVVTNVGYDLLVSQRISALTEARPQPLAPEFKEYPHWLRNFVLTRMVGQIPAANAPLAFALIRRTRDALRAFDQGCVGLRTFLKRPGVDAYFDTLERFEAAMLSVSFGRDIAARVLGRRLFEKGDTTSEDSRIYWIYCVIKHNDPGTLPPGHSHAVWLENDGLHGAQVVEAGIDKRHVTFDELRAEIRGLAQIANAVSAGHTRTEEV